MSSSEQNEIIFSSTLVVGLGGSGIRTILHLKKLLKDVYQKDIPSIEYLGIDTDEVNFWSEEEGSIGLDPDDFIKCEVSDSERLIRVNSNIIEWFSGSWKIRSITKGAHQNRSCGRLALWGGDADNINDKIKRKIHNLKSLSKKIRNSVDFDHRIRVFLVGSLAGGTGSGMFLDIGAMIRNELTPTDYFTPIFLLPGIFEGLLNTASVFTNTYGALREIEYSFREKFEYPGEWDLAGIDLKQVLNDNGGGIFDYIYLIDNINRGGNRINNVNDLFDVIAQGIHVLSTDTGNKVSDSIDNNSQIDQLVHNNTRKYGSFGVSTLEFPVNWYFIKYKLEIAVDLIDRDFFGDSAHSGEKLKYKKFIIENQLEEQGSKDQMLEAMLKDIQIVHEICPEEIDVEEIEGLIGQFHEGLKVEESRLKGIAEKKSDELFSRIEDALKEKIVDLFKSKSNIHKIIDFLSRLGTYFKICREELNESRIKAEERYKLLEGGLDVKTYKIMTAKKSFFMFRSSKILAGFQEYITSINIMKEYKKEIIETDNAVQFLVRIGKTVEVELESINNFKEKLDKIKKDLEDWVIRYNMPSNLNVKFFTQEIRPDEFENMEYDLPDGFVEWNKDNYKNNYIKYTDKDKLLFFSEESDSIKKLKNTDIQKAMDLMKKDPGKLKNIMDKLKVMAIPLWNYDPAEMITNKPEIINIISNNNIDKTKEVLDSLLDKDQSYSLSYDKTKIYMSNFEGFAPLFSIRSVKEMEEDYSSLRKKQPKIALHLHKDWERSDILPDLFKHEKEK